jgi:TrmH family RNA methyltransferase
VAPGGRRGAALAAGLERTSGAAGLGWRHRRVQRLRRLVRRRAYRESERAFVVEGPRAVGAALQAGALLEAVYVAAGAAGRPEVATVLDRASASGVRVLELAPGVLERVADTATPQPLLAVASFLDVPLRRLEDASLVVVCVGVRDPGNLGTLVRSAGAAGADGVVCCAGSVDVYNPKTVRASAGSVFQVPIVAGGEAGEVLEEIAGFGMRRVAAVARGGQPFTEADLSGRVAFVLGNEAAGLPDEVTRWTDGAVTIPLSRGAESLNVGVAAALLCYEAVRQRRARS